MPHGQDVRRVLRPPEADQARRHRRDGDKRTSSFLWQWSFNERRCLIPVSSRNERSETAAGKPRVRVSMPGEPVSMAAGPHDENVDPKTGTKVPVYTMCRVPPNFGTVHDHAALELVGTHPDANAFDVKSV